MKKIIFLLSILALSTLTTFAQLKALSRAAKSSSRVSRPVSRTSTVSRAEQTLARSKPPRTNVGRTGQQARLRELKNDDKLGKADKGWLKQEDNAVKRGNQSNMRTPPGKQLAHERGREASKGYSYKHSNLQTKELHKTQHKIDNNGKKQTERPLIGAN